MSQIITKIISTFKSRSLGLFLLSSAFIMSLVTFCIYLGVYKGWFQGENDSIINLAQTGEDEFEEVILNEEISAVTGEKFTYELYSSNSQFSTDKPKFADIAEGVLEVNPKTKHFGDYKFTIVSEDEKARYTYKFALSVILPEVDFAKLKSDVEDVIGTDEIDRYGVYVYDLKREDGFDIHGDEVFMPGSTSKLPYGINVLRDVDAGKYPLSSVSYYLECMLQLSNNECMMYLDNLLGGYKVHNWRVRNELGINNYFRYPHTCTPNDIGKTYYNIYHQKYLSEELNDYLIDTLINAHPGFDNRLKQGLPDDIDVAHKTGYVWTGNGVAYNDTALVFGEVTDFILVVINKDTTREAAIANMKPIAETVYGRLN